MEAKGDASKPLFIVEGPVKALAVQQAGGLAIGCNGGIWASEPKGRARTLHHALERFEWRNRPVYLVPDADQLVKTHVRQATIRAFFLFTQAGAQVRLLTKWPLTEAKGIDDYFYWRKTAAESRAQPPEVLAERVEAVKDQDFLADCLELADLSLIERELYRSVTTKPWFHQLARRVAKTFDIPKTAFKYQEPSPPDRETEDNETNRPEWCVDPRPWPEPVGSLGKHLDAIEAEYLAFFDMSIEQADACVLWIPTTYFMDLWQIHPYLGITAAVKGSGKTTLLTFTSRFCYRPWPSSNITAATVYRIVHEFRPSMFITEIGDTFTEKPELKTVFKAAYTRATALVPRMEKVGDKWVPVYYSAWCPKAYDLTGRISSYDDAIEERSIEIHMHKETHEHRNFWEEVMSKDPLKFRPYQEKLWRYRQENLEKVLDHDAHLPVMLNSRIRENWRALFTMAGLVGSRWLEKAHASLETIHKGQLPILPEPEYLAKALRDLVQTHPYLIERTVKDREFLPTKHILDGASSHDPFLSGNKSGGLRADKEAPWADRQPDGLTDAKLAILLGDFRVESKQYRIPRLNGERVRGYLVDELKEKVFSSIRGKLGMTM